MMSRALYFCEKMTLFLLGNFNIQQIFQTSQVIDFEMVVQNILNRAHKREIKTYYNNIIDINKQIFHDAEKNVRG